MRLYSVRDITEMVLKALRDTHAFPVMSVDRGTIEITQSTGRVSQSFRITIESNDKDPSF
jgi:hypothetical protein